MIAGPRIRSGPSMVANDGDAKTMRKISVMENPIAIPVRVFIQIIVHRCEALNLFIVVIKWI